MKLAIIMVILLILTALSPALWANIPASERQALIDLYNSTNGPGWTLPLVFSHWLEPAGTEREWRGVTVDSDNTTVIDLDLGSMNLVGTLPASLANLANLRSLRLKGNRLTGAIPASLGELKILWLLDLSYNQLTGSIPPSLGAMSSLMDLTLTANQLTGSIPTSLGNLSYLTSLLLAGNRLTGSIPASLGSTLLRYLYLNQNNLSGTIPAELGLLSHLETLHLHSNQLIGGIPTSFANLTSLKDLDIGYNGLYAGDVALEAFLNSKNSSWAATQTVAPKKVAAAIVNPYVVNVTWDPIPYSWDTGWYRISVGTTMGGPYTFYQQTANKNTTWMSVTGLTPGTPYYFVVSTHTDVTPNNSNAIDSENSAATTAIPGERVKLLDSENLLREVDGFVADGAARVVIQVKNLPGNVTDPGDIGLSAPNFYGARLADDAAVSNGTFTRTIIAPQYFVREAFPEDEALAERFIGLFISVKNGETLSRNIKIKRTPVVLMHGLWSSGKKAWEKGFLPALSQKHFGYVAPSYPNSAHFESNKQVIGQACDDARRLADADRLVVKKVDVVAHSMGGLLTKLYGNPSKIKSITTIGTPHWGSPIADWLWGWVQLPYMGGFIGKAIGAAIGNPMNGAIEDLRENGGIHCAGICGQSIPSYTIAGVVSIVSDNPDSFVAAFLHTYNFIHAAEDSSLTKLNTFFFKGKENDWIVTEESQKGDFPDPIHLRTASHMSETEDAEIIEKTIMFLNAGVRAAPDWSPLEKAAPSSGPGPISSRAIGMGVSSGQIQIVSPAEGQIFRGGDTVDIQLSISNNNATALIATSTGQTALLGAPPYQYQYVIPAGTAGAVEIVAGARDEAGFIGEAQCRISVPVASKLLDLDVYPKNTPWALQVGLSIPLEVHGIYEDSVGRNLTPSACGTSYGSTNPAVAEVSVDGLIHVLTAGTTKITVQNSGLVKEIDLTGYFSAEQPPRDYYVSPAGSDAGGDGSQARPWKTIQKAANAMSAGDTCHVADGEYAEMVRPAGSGTAGQYISFVTDGSSATLNGSRRITGWTVHSGNIWKANVGWAFEELFVDRQRMVLARWPNLTSGDIYRPNFYQATANGGKTSIIDSARLTQPAGYWNGAKIFMVPGWGWTAEQRDVSGYDASSHRISFAAPIEFSESYDADQYSLYFLYDKLALLDAPSEWYLDRASGTIYLWLPDGGDPNGHLVEASGGSGGFDLRNRAYIRIAGFHLVSGDIKMLDATGCRVEEVRHLFPAAELAVSGSDNVITRSEIAFASLTGVNLAGTGNTLSQCHVHHCNYLGRIFQAIVMLGNRSLWPSGGSRNSIVDCSLHDSGRDGVNTIGGQDMSECLIEHNEIYNAGLIAKDLAGFYSTTTNGGGTIIRYNTIHDIWPRESFQFGGKRLGSGIYFDVTSSGFFVHHNLIYRTGGYAITMNGPTLNTLVYNNTAVGSGGGWGDVIESAAQVGGTVFANNLAVLLDGRKGFDNLLGWCIDFREDVPAYHHNGYYSPLTSTQFNNRGLEATAVVGDPLFVSAGGNDFSLLAGSPMIDKGAVIPGITDGFVGAAPDIGAFELGGSVQPGPRDEWWKSTMHAIQLSKAALNFGAGPGATTSAQSVLITSTGPGTLLWTGISSAAWITSSPSSGTGAAKIAIGVNPTGLAPGSYSGFVAFSDPNSLNSPQIVTVNLTVYASAATTVPFGDFATPIDGTINVTGAIPVTGWVLDDIQVTKVEIWRDPVISAGEVNALYYIGDGLFVEGARPDIETGYPSYPFHYAAGWGYMLLTNFLPNQGNGVYTIYAIATDMEGNQVTLGMKTITCSNATAMKPFGTIDTPAQGGEASGNRFVNFGWVLTPMPKTVPKDGHLITVYVDSVLRGNLSTPPNLYNAYRPDVSNNFPGLMNTGGPGAGGPVGAFYLDTTVFANGVHTIWWIAYDNDGQGDGIGSRYFTISNTGGSQAPAEQKIPALELAFLPVSFSPVLVKTGYDLEADFSPRYPDAKGVVQIEIPEVSRIEIEFGEGVSESRSQYDGYLVVGEELRPLPIGSTLDVRTGRFSWMPGPGFLGTYDLVFVERTDFGADLLSRLRVKITPKFEARLSVPRRSGSN